VNEKPWSPATVASDHRLVALDANILIYVLEGNEAFGARARAVVDAIDGGALAASMATVGQVEILAGPARIGDAGVFERTADEIRSLGITLVPLTPAVAEDAAWIRGTSGAGLADAIHVAGARAAGATAFITNDRRIKSRPNLDVFYLDDLALDPPLA
jgi:predicted nucleic acid-binding protein